MGDTHVYLMRPVAPTPRFEPSELQNLHRNSTVGLHSEKFTMLWYGWHGFEQRITNNAIDEWCKRVCLCKRTTFTADSTFVHFSVLVW